jgi:antitoxin HicB
MRTAQEYLSLPYTMSVRRDDRDSVYVARIKEISACTGHGDTAAAALEMLQDNLEDWIADAIEQGDPIPLPEDLSELPSGKWVQRVPRSIHKRLAEVAETEGVSLNQLVTSFISESLGRRDSPKPQGTALPILYGSESVLDQSGIDAYGYPPAIGPNLGAITELLVDQWGKNANLANHLVFRKSREEDSHGYKETTLRH